MVVNIVVNYRIKRKMLKETETEKNRLFVTFLSLVTFQLGGRRATWLRLWGPVPYGKSSPGYCITFIKRLNEGLRKQLLGQKPLISPGLFI